VKKKIIILISIAFLILIFAFLCFVGWETERANKSEGAPAEIAVQNSPSMSNSYKIIDDSVSITNKVNNNMENSQSLTLTSPAFVSHGDIPAKYTCDGKNINPPLEISGAHADAQTLVLIMDDPDAPAGTWDHWLKFNIPITTKIILEGKEPSGISGVGTGGELTYAGPCPPDKTHRYFFKLYTLDIELALPAGSNKAEIEEAMVGHILQTAELVGKYERE